MSQAFLAILLSSSSWKYSSDIAFLIRGTTFTSPPSGVNSSPSKADTSYVVIYQSEVVLVFTRVRHLYQALFSPSDSFFSNNTTASIIHSHYETQNFISAPRIKVIISEDFNTPDYGKADYGT
ncbi:hypothetical protein WAI453_008466 [Rhynchosporium graminicola]